MSTFQKLRIEERKTRKEMIISAAIELCQEMEVHEIKMGQIAKRIGTSTACIYNYFPRQDDILVEISLLHLKRAEELFDKKMKAGRISLEELAFFGLDYVMENKFIFQILALMITGQLKPKDSRRYESLRGRFLGILEKVKSRTEIDMDRYDAFQAIYASLIDVVMSYKNYQGRSSEEIKPRINQLIHALSRFFETARHSHLLQDIPKPDKLDRKHRQLCFQ